MITFMFSRDYSSGCAENWLWRSEGRSREMIRKLFSIIEVRDDGSVDQRY